jgi:hypothetical protein
MTADEIRAIPVNWATPQNVYSSEDLLATRVEIQREIAAQLAELNVRYSEFLTEYKKHALWIRRRAGEGKE